jgi:HEAT repeat protein
MNLGILTTDVDLIIQSWDQHLATMTGKNSDDVCGISLLEIVPELKENDDFFHCVKEVFHTGNNQTFAPIFAPYLIPCSPQFVGIYCDKMQQNVILAPFKEAEQIKGLIITIEDITQKIEAEKELQTQMDMATKEAEMNQNISAIIEKLDDDNWAIRQQVVNQLVQKKQPEITAELINLFRQEYHNPNILNSVIQTLTLSQIDPIPALIECLQEPEADLRIYSALVLGERQDQKAIPALIKALADPNENVKFHAIEALGRLKAKEAREDLIELAKSEDFFLAFAALDSLVKIGNQQTNQNLLSLLENTFNWQVRRETVDVLSLQNTPQLTQELLHLLRSQHQNPNILNSILQILALSNVDAVPALIECLQDRDPDVRLYTALALGERGDARAIPPLLKALEDDNFNVRYHAIDALGHLGSMEVVDALIKIAQSADFFLAFPAIDALLRIGDRTIAPQLLPLLNHELLSAQVAEALAHLGDAMVIPAMVKAFNQDQAVSEIATAIATIYERAKDQEEKAYLLELIAQSIEPVGQKNLLNALNNADDQQLQALTLILSCLKGADIEETLVKLLSHPAVRDMIIEPLVACGSRLTPLLLPYLQEGDLETRQVIVLLLGRMGSTQAVPELTRLLTTEPELILYITSALAQIGDHQAFDTLISLLGHPDVTVRLGAISALNSLGHPQMPQQLLSLLANPDPLVRESAVKIAGYFAFSECVDLLFACTEDPDEAVRQTAIKHLPYLEDEAQVITTLIHALTTDTPKVRVAAIQALGELNSEASIPYLLNALEDYDLWVRYYAVKALGQSAPFLEPQTLSQVLAQLKFMVQQESTEPVKAIATETLGIVGNAEVIPLLTQLSMTANEEVARSAIRALSKIPLLEAIPPLLSALNSPHPQRRMDALQALRERGGSEAEVTLQKIATQDPESKLVEAAIESLAQISTSESIRALLELTVDPSTRTASIQTLASRKFSENLTFHAYIDDIAQGLNHLHQTVRCATIEILKRLKHPHASAYLIKALADPDTTVRLMAVNALVDLGNHTCLSQLSQLAQNDPCVIVRRAAQKGLLQ